MANARSTTSKAEPAPRFFARPEAFHAWLAKNHDRATELWVGFHKKGTGQPSITWPESVDEALCFGWIDGVRKGIDADSYKIRFSPRQAKSIWSAVNIGRVAVLKKAGRMQPAGLAAFERRREERSRVYAFEQDQIAFAPELEKEFRKNKKAWTWFSIQPPGYRKQMTWWVISAKQEATRHKRLARLMEESAAGRRIQSMAPPAKGKNRNA